MSKKLNIIKNIYIIRDIEKYYMQNKINTYLRINKIFQQCTDGFPLVKYINRTVRTDRCLL